MNMAKEIIAIISAVVGIITTAIPLVIFLIKYIKASVKNADWAKLLKIIPDLIIDAEKFINYSGAEKLEFVKTKLRLFCVENNITFDEDKFCAEIESLVALTKSVNARGTVAKTGV